MKVLINKFLKPGESLKWRTFQATFILLLTTFYTQGLRLAGNLIMTRLLYPEAFGLMLIVSLVMTALGQFSDAGVRPAVILYSRGRERNYLNTAWVILVGRGILLTIIALLSAWPVAQLYDESILVGLVAITSASAIISGFKSPQTMISERDIKRVRLMLLEIIPQTVTMAAGLLILWHYPSVWVLAGMSVAAAALTTILSFILFPSPELQFKADKAIFKEIIGFGKWIFLATGMTFLAAEGDKFIVSGFLTVTQLGIFSIAITFAKLVDTISSKLAHFLLLPVYIEIDKQDDKFSAQQKTKKIKLTMFGLMFPLVMLFALFGSQIIEFLYDDRYLDAGWMLQVMALGGMFSMTNNGFNAFILSKADSYQYSMLNLYRVIVSGISIFGGGYFFGVVGIVYAIALVPVLSYFILFSHIRKYKIDSMKSDLLLFIVPLLIIFFIWYHVGWPGISHASGLS